MSAVAATLDEAYRAILDVIARDRGLDFSQWRPNCLMRRIEHRIRTVGANGPSEYLPMLMSSPDELNSLLDSITINVTEFFRNPEVFEAIARDVVPRIVDETIAHRYPRIRCWCAGASSGAEPLSIAILFAEEFERRGRQFPIVINATDIDTIALAAAEAGRYPDAAVRAVPTHILAKYFTKSSGGYVVSDAIRLLVKIRCHDMILRQPLMANDLVVCRNVLIYFSKELQLKVMNNLWKGLRRGGTLVLGQTESLRDPNDRFSTINGRMRIYVKK